MSNSLHPYSYWEENGQYFFITPSGAKYVAYFLTLPLAENLYTFNFDRLQEGDGSIVDINVFDTICDILFSFFCNHRNSLLIVCDSIDGREEARMRLFDSWYLRIAPPELMRIDRRGKANEYKLFISLFVWADNPVKEEIVGLLDEYCRAVL